MTKKIWFGAIGASMLGLSAMATLSAQDRTPDVSGVVDPSKITGGAYVADPAHSLVQWRVNHMGFNDYFGLFGDVEGTLQLDPERPGQSSVDVTIPVESVTVASEGLREHLLRPAAGGGEPDFFGANPAPARFVSKSVQISPGGMTADIVGDLTLNGVVQEVELYARFTGTGPNPMSGAETVGFEGRGVIQRSDFGLDFGIPMVGDDVELEFSVAFEKAAAG